MNLDQSKWNLEMLNITERILKVLIKVESRVSKLEKGLKGSINETCS